METKFVQTSLVRLQYFEHGHGPEVVVLVHGFSASGRIWRLTQEALDPARFCTIAFSNRGAGDSDHTPHEADYSFESFAADLYAAVQALGLGPFTLVGHSMGCKTVTLYALDHQDSITALVLLDGRLTAASLPAGWEEQMRQAPPATNQVPSNLGADGPDIPEDFRYALGADIARNPIVRLIGTRRSSAKTDLLPRLPELRMPVLVAGGDSDTTAPVENSIAEFLALSKETRSLHIFHGVGHSPNVEVAAQFAAVLDRFVAKTVAATAVATVR